jgi:hypothetical protein
MNLHGIKNLQKKFPQKLLLTDIFNTSWSTERTKIIQIRLNFQQPNLDLTFMSSSRFACFLFYETREVGLKETVPPDLLSLFLNQYAAPRSSFTLKNFCISFRFSEIANLDSVLFCYLTPTLYCMRISLRNRNDIRKVLGVIQGPRRS